ncbi:MAG: ArsR family transcriptional regulator [Chloroflexi bacterium]|nr:ArsR family transcriptional regulator [Chloroflexota bacterium]
MVNSHFSTENHTTSSERDSAAHLELVSIQDSMLDGLGQLASYFGFNKIIGQLYAYLLFETEPLSLDQLCERMSLSKAGVSMHMRTLEQLGMVRQAFVKGEHRRKKFYEAETDLWQIIRNLLSVREKREIDRTLNILRANVVRLKQIQTGQKDQDDHNYHRASVFLERIEMLEALFSFARVLITSMLDESKSAEEWASAIEE